MNQNFNYMNDQNTMNFKRVSIVGTNENFMKNVFDRNTYTKK